MLFTSSFMLQTSSAEKYHGLRYRTEVCLRTARVFTPNPAGRCNLPTTRAGQQGFTDTEMTNKIYHWEVQESLKSSARHDSTLNVKPSNPACSYQAPVRYIK